MSTVEVNKNQVCEHLIKSFVDHGCVEKDQQKRGYYITSEMNGWNFLYSDGIIRPGFSKPYAHTSSFWRYKKDATSFYNNWTKRIESMKRQEVIDREEKGKQLETFYAVWKKSGSILFTIRHYTKEEAVAEARQLSRKTNDSYYVLKTIGIVKQAESPIEFEEIN